MDDQKITTQDEQTTEAVAEETAAPVAEEKVEEVVVESPVEPASDAVEEENKEEATSNVADPDMAEPPAESPEQPVEETSTEEVVDGSNEAPAEEIVEDPAPVISNESEKSQSTHNEPAESEDSSDITLGSEATPEAETPSEAVEETSSDVILGSEATPESDAGQVDDMTTEKPEEPTAPASNVPADARWYIVHTYSGHENKVARGVQQRAETMGFTDKIFDIIVPTREVTKVAQGKKTQVQEKIFPGYVLVRMILTDETWLMVRTTQGVTAFIGAGNKPTPISEKEVEAIQKFMKLEEPLYKTGFSVNEAVKIVDGPFADFLGTIESIDDAKGKLRVLVSIFGRETPVELDFLQVAKI